MPEAKCLDGCGLWAVGCWFGGHMSLVLGNNFSEHASF